MEQTLPRLPEVYNTLNAVLLNHQWLYFSNNNIDTTSPDKTRKQKITNEGDEDDEEEDEDDASSIRTATPTPSLYRSTSNISPTNTNTSMTPNYAPPTPFPVSPSDDSDVNSLYSIDTMTTTTSTRKRIQRNKHAMELSLLHKQFRRTYMGSRRGEFIWRTSTDASLLVLLHWAYKAIDRLDVFLKYHVQNAATLGVQGQLPVGGYVDLVKAGWVAEVLAGVDGMGEEDGVGMGKEGRVLRGLLVCVSADILLPNRWHGQQ